jgi:nitronate monooxygenase
MGIKENNMTQQSQIPEIIQGGMGVGVSNWRLARAVAQQGGLGVVSGTGIDIVMVRRLQLGDEGGHVRRALAAFPWPEITHKILETYFIEGGKPADRPFKLPPLPNVPLRKDTVQRMVAANFVEVFLAKDGHKGKVGINYLEKIQVPTLPSLLGAMLADVDVVLMGAGIPITIPGILDQLATWNQVELKLDVESPTGIVPYVQTLNPADYFPEPRPALKRPAFLAIVSSEIVAKTLLRRATGTIDGFVVEGHTAGGHNAPPRKVKHVGDTVPEPAFSAKDDPDLVKLRELERPFWLAGGYASPGSIQQAHAEGAEGIQAGTIFAFTNESGIIPHIKQQVLQQCLDGTLKVFTDFRASPTGYPFKIVDVPGSTTDESFQRERVCDLGYLRQLYWTDAGTIGYRCPGEAVNNYLIKGGKIEDTVGRQCLCNGLSATIGLGQIREAGPDRPMVTAGEDFSFVPALVRDPIKGYSVSDVLNYLRGSLTHAQ